MDFQEAVTIIKKIIEDGTRVTAIEQELKIPKNNLSGFLSGTRATPEKWQKKLIAWAEKHQSNTSSQPVEISKKKEKVISAAPAPLPSRKEINLAPPPGLSKSDQLKWWREHAQTLQ